MVSRAVIRPLGRVVWARTTTTKTNLRTRSGALGPTTAAVGSKPITNTLLRTFSSAQPSSSSNDEETMPSPKKKFAQKVDEHTEEQKRRRLSDVRTLVVTRRKVYRRCIGSHSYKDTLSMLSNIYIIVSGFNFRSIG